MRRKINIILSFILIMTVLFSPISNLKADAAANLSESLFKGASSVNGNLNKWLLDEANGNIYLITENKFLSIFDAKTLALKKEIEFTYISDIDLYNGKLYAALEWDQEVAVINTNTAAVEKKIKVTNNPHKMALVSNKIFYVPRYYKGWDGHIVDYSKVYVHNLADSKDAVAMSMTAIPGYENSSASLEITDLVADTASNRLFVSAANVYSEKSYLFSIGSTDYKVIDNGKQWGFDGYRLGIFVNGEDVFFGSYRLDKENLGKSYGNYEGRVAFAKGDYVFSHTGIFDRESFIKIGGYSEYDGQQGNPFQYSTFLVDSNDNVYLGMFDSPISRGALSSFIKIDLESGNKLPDDAAAIEYNADKIGIDTMAKRLSITQWLVDTDNNLIYALSKENNRLMILGLHDLKLKKQLVVGNSPSHMAMSGGKLYVALSGINQVAVVDLKTQTIERNIVLQHKPGALAVDGSKMFYMGYEPYDRTSEKYLKLYMYDLTQNTEVDILANSATRFLESNMIIDTANHRLYLGHSTHDGAITISTTDYKILSTSGYGRDSYRAVVSDDNEKLFYSYAKLDKNDFSIVYGYFKEAIVYTKGSYAFSTKAVYDANSFEKLAELPIESERIYMDGSSNVYMFDKKSNSIKKFSLLPLVAGFPKAYAEEIKNTDYSIPRDAFYELGRIMGNIKTVIDDDNNLIYAISNEGNKLQVISRTNLKLIKELVIGQGLTDMKLVDGKLYIAASGIKSIVVYNTASQTISQTYKLSDGPIGFEVEDNKIFYRGSLKLYAYDMLTKQEKEFTFYDFKRGWDTIPRGRFFLDSENHILYADVAGAKPTEALYAVSTIDMKPIKLPIMVEKYEDLDYYGMPVFRGRELLLGQTVYERDTFKQVGDALKGGILYADDEYIITSYEAYLRKSHAKLGDMPEYYENMQVDKAKNAYIVMNREHYIKKTSIEELLASLKNKTSTYDEYVKGDLVDAPKPVEKITFNDIKNHWAKVAIEELAQKKIVNGIGNNFAPNKVVTRAEFTAMLIRAIDPEGIEDVKKDIERGNVFEYFPDVKSKDWFYPSAIVARRIQLVLGDAKGNFSPNALITREEMAVMALRAMYRMNREAIQKDDNVLSVFQDNARISKWARTDAASAVKMGIMNGTPGMLFAPQGNATRAEAAAVLKRIMDKFEQ
jgi:DNA-binding beta-propeller fold protein YncE